MGVRADGQLADKLLVQGSLDRLQPSLRSMDEPVPARALGDREDHVMERGFPLAMDAVMPQRRDGQAERGRELALVVPAGRPRRRSCSRSARGRGHVPVTGAQRLGEQAIGLLGPMTLVFLRGQAMWVVGLGLAFGSRRGSRMLRRNRPGFKGWPVVSTISLRVAASSPTACEVICETSRTMGWGPNKDFSQSRNPTVRTSAQGATRSRVWPGCSGPRMHHLRCSGLVAPTLRTWEPWRREPHKAPPRRNTVAIQAGCRSVGPEHPGQTNEARS